MFTQHASTSSDRRPLTLRRRADVVIQESVFQQQRSWVLKDPVALKYYRLQEPEYEAYMMIDGVNSYSQIKQHLERSFPEMKIRIEDVYALANSLHKNGLLLSDAAGQDQPLKQRHQKELKQKALKLVMSVMSLKFPGVDPDRFLNWLYPKVRWFFSKTCFAICLLISLCALTLVGVNLEEFYRKLPEFGQFFNVKNLLFMGTMLIVTKSIHELGHGLMCKHFGGECHEIGFMMLVMMPAMYCNTSDSWTLPNKWHRIAIGAAGMYVEIVMAAIATFIWWYTQPGALHYLALNVMFLCSFTTLVFNANPLLRYDGYFMLADFLEIPNLSQKSNMALTSQLRVTCLGMKPIESRLMPKKSRVAFAIYAVASFVYRWLVMLMIFWFLIEMFRPYGLEVIGQMLIFMSLVGMLVIPGYKVAKFFLYPGRFREVKAGRSIVTVVVSVVALVMLFSVPVPYHVAAPFVIRPINAQMVYATQPGMLTEVKFRPGDSVEAGQLIARVESIDSEIKSQQLLGRQRQLESDIEFYKTMKGRSPRLLAESRARLRDVKQQLELHDEARGQLKAVARRSGKIIPPPNVPQRLTEKNGRKRWSGSPLDLSNENLPVEPGTLLCMVGDPETMKAVVMIEQSDAVLVKAGQQVRLMLAEIPGVEFSGIVKRVSQDQMDDVPRELSSANGGSVATRPSSVGGEQPMLNYYEATVEIDSKEGRELLTGFRGKAKVKIDSAPLGQRLVRYFRQIIHFR